MPASRHQGSCLAPFWSSAHVSYPFPAEIRTFYLWILVHRSTVDPSLWRAEIPDLDYFAQARTAGDAIEAAQEVAQEVVINDLNCGRDPIRQNAAREVRTQMAAVMSRSQPCILVDALKNPDSFDALIVRIAVAVSAGLASPTPQAHTVADSLPMMQPRSSALG